MNSTSYAIRFNLLVTLIVAMSLCYSAHLVSAPWWISLLAVFVIGYRFMVHYALWPPLPIYIKILIIISALALLRWQFGSFSSNAFYNSFLLTFIWLKLFETHRRRDIQVLALVNFYVIFSALLLNQELWVFIYLLIALTANLALLIKLVAPTAPLSLLSRISARQILLAIPVSLLLFFVFPRISTPFWQVPTAAESAVGFKDSLTPGAISSLFQDTRVAMRVSYQRPIQYYPYWRGLILNHFDGRTWRQKLYQRQFFMPLKPMQGETPDYDILLEPHQQKWLFYQENPLFSNQALSFAKNIGLVKSNQQAVNHRYSYALKEWPVRYQAISQQEREVSTQLPIRSNETLIKWAKEHFRQQDRNPEKMVQFLKDWIHDKPYWYTLSPAAIGEDRNSLQRFWFETRSGYCEHYASAVTLILRAAGIPARVIVGYHGGVWNPMGEFLQVQQNHAHAWLEYWVEGKGWLRFDPVSAINRSRVDADILGLLDSLDNKNLDPDWISANDNLGWLIKLRYYWESSLFFTEKWFLFYNQESQSDLLAMLGLDHWNAAHLLQLSILILLIGLAFTGLWYWLRQRKRRDPIKVAYRDLLAFLASRGYAVSVYQSIHQNLSGLMADSGAEEQRQLILKALEEYEHLRLRNIASFSREKAQQLTRLLNQLGQSLKNGVGR